jgi:hypothetical protein
MRGSSSFVLLLLGAILVTGCSVERSGLYVGPIPGDDDLGVASTDLGIGDVDGGGVVERDLGVVETDLGVPVEIDLGTVSACDPTACPGRFCAGEACGYARSCNELKNAPGGPTTNGTYTLDGDGPDFLAAADAFCDMTSDAGGWTLVMKANGGMPTFRYDSPYWTDEVELAATPLYDAIEAKLRTYRTVEFTQMRVVMVTGTETRAVILDVGAGSCVQLFNRGYSMTTVDRDTWLAMVPDVSLQDNCGMQGINVAPDSDELRVRIGIIGNNEGNCNTPNSRIGVGGAGENDGVTTGNVARWNGIGEDRNTVSFAYVFVR